MSASESTGPRTSGSSTEAGRGALAFAVGGRDEEGAADAPHASVAATDARTSGTNGTSEWERGMAERPRHTARARWTGALRACSPLADFFQLQPTRSPSRSRQSNASAAEAWPERPFDG